MVSLQSMLGQRYGHRPLRAQIPEQEFFPLCGAVDDRDGRELVRKWYEKDENAVPPEYTLKKSYTLYVVLVCLSVC